MPQTTETNSSLPTETAPTIGAAEATHESLSKRVVLLAEDDDATRIAMNYILTTHGFEVQQVRNGQEAVEAINHRRFDAMLVDIEMPVIDGMRVIATAHRSPQSRNTPIIVLSKHASRDHVKKCILLGAKDFVVKQGLKVDVLIEKVRNLIIAAESAPPEAPPATTPDRDAAVTKHPGAPATESAKTPEPAAPAEAPVVTKPESEPAPKSDDPGPMLDQRLFKEKAESIGRIERDKCREMLDRTELPSIFPALRGEVIMGLKAGPSAMEDVVRAVEQDPAMLVMMLDHANRNPGGRSEALDVDQCVHWIGQSSIEDLLKETQAQRQRIDPKLRPWLLRWWCHSMATAEIASELAQPMRQSRTVARVAGMMHEIGRLLMLCSEAGEKLMACYELGPRLSVPWTYAEQTLVGMTHKQASAEFCTRHHVPATIANVCDAYDLDAAGRERLGEQNASLAALIGTADQLAKAAGYSSVPNDELMPIPASMIKIVQENAVQIDRAIAEIQTLCTWRLGNETTASNEGISHVAGLCAAVVSSMNCPWNPIQRTLTAASMTVQPFATLKDLMESRAIVDIIIIDYADTNLSLGLPMLRRLNKTQAFAKIPKILLARRSDEPEKNISQAMLWMNVYPTPIRQQSLLQMIHRILNP